MTEIKLNRAEAFNAAVVGIRRQLKAIENGRQSKAGLKDRDDWGPHIEGAAAECAAAKLTGRYWQADVVNNPIDLGGDVGTLQVRSSPRPYGDLVLHPKDPDDATFMLLIGQIPAYRVAGVIVARDGKLEQYWRDDMPHPAFFVPQAALSYPDLDQLRLTI